MSVIPEPPASTGEPVASGAPGGEDQRPAPPPSPAPADLQDLRWLRVSAALIDLAVLLGPFLILSVATGGASGVEGGFSFELTGGAATLFLAVVLGYYFGLEAAFGQTVGKYLMELQVVRPDGSRPPFSAITVRTVLRIVDWLPLLYLVGFVTMLATGKRQQRLGDLAARTRVELRAAPARHRGVVATLVAVVLLLVVGVAVQQAAVSDQGSDGGTATQNVDAVQQGAVLLQDDFSDPTSGWGNDAYQGGESGYVDGAYRIFVAPPERQFLSNVPADAPVPALRVEVETTQLSGAAGDLVGVHCYTDVDSDVGYMVGIAPADRGYAIVAFDGDNYRLLESSGEAAAAVRPLDQENQLRVDCIARPDGSTAMTLTANGHELVRAEDETGGRGFDAVGLFVDTQTGGAEALFDDIVVTQLLLM